MRKRRVGVCGRFAFGWTIVASPRVTRRPRSRRPTVSAGSRFTSGATVEGDGAGQTIALIETYRDRISKPRSTRSTRAYGLPNVTLDVINQAGTQTNLVGRRKSRSTSSGPTPLPLVPTSSWSRPRPGIRTRNSSTT